MKRNAMTLVLMISMVIGSSLTVCEELELMPDGRIFDAKAYLNCCETWAPIQGYDMPDSSMSFEKHYKYIISLEQ